MTPLYTFNVEPHQARNDNNTGNGCNPGAEHVIGQIAAEGSEVCRSHSVIYISSLDAEGW